MTVSATTYSLLLQSTFDRSTCRVLAVALMACAFCVLGAPTAQAQSTIHVTEDGDAAADGSSWGSATTLQTALDTATGSDVIVIAEGTYTPGSDRDDSFTITGDQDGLKVYGGWEGTEPFAGIADVESQLEDRDLEANPTVLSGDIDSDDAANADGITETPNDINGSNSYTIVYLDGTTGEVLTSATVLDGLVITGGQADGSDTSDFPRVGGGGAYCDGEGDGNECSPKIVNVTFTGNLGTVGSALFNNGANSGTSNPQVVHSAFTSNSAVIGGAIFNIGFDGTSNPQISHVSFDANSAENNGGAIFNDGRSNGTSNPQITHVTFTGNTAGSNGGAIYNEGRDEGETSPQVTNTTFIGNSAGSNGGAIYNTGALGDGFQSGVSSPQITNTVFADNFAEDGGAMYSTGVFGTVSPEITNVTFVGNTASNNGGALANRGSTGTDTSPQITNSILWDNSASSGSEIHNNGASPMLSHTLIEGGANGSGVAGNGNGTDGTNLGDDSGDIPLFADARNPAGNDGVFGTVDDGLRLQPGSAALDAGNNDAVPAGITTDLLDQDRIQDSDEDGTATVSLGAYEGFITSPVTRGIAPTTAYPGSTISIRGVNFTGTENVTIGGTSVSYTVQSDTEITATVPTEASPVSAPVAVSTPNGTTSPRAFRIAARPYGSGQALTLDGNGDYVSADAASDVVADADAFTMEAWALLDSNTDRPAVLAFNGDVEDNKNILFYDSGQFQYYDPDITFQSSSDTFAPDRWHHVAVVIEADDSGTLYVNGTEQATFTTSVRPVSGGGFSIGQEWDDAVPSDFFAGQIDEVRLWDTARSPDEIRTGMHQTVDAPASAPGLVGYWRFDEEAPDEEASSVAYDAAGPSIGTLEGDATRTAASGAPLGQTAVLVSGGTSQTVGPDGGTAEVTNQSATDTDLLAVYQYGTAAGDLVEAGVPGEDFDATGVTQRLNVTWGIEPVAGSSASADVTFDFSGLAGINDPGAVLLLKREGPGQPWQDVTGQWTLDAEAQTFMRSGVDSFSEYAIAGDEQALPVELAGLEAQRSGEDAVTVQWQTLSETNNAGFEVQRRTGSGTASKLNVETSRRDVSTGESGESWETVARLDGAGTTDTPQSYRFEDTDLPYAADSLSYRLRQVDTDGTESFSEAVTVTRQVTETELLPTYPNPAHSQATIRYAVPHQQAVRIHLYDMLGRRVQTVVDTDAEGRTEAQLDVSHLASGTYFLRMQTEAGPVDTQRVTVVR